MSSEFEILRPAGAGRGVVGSSRAGLAELREGRARPRQELAGGQIWPDLPGSGVELGVWLGVAEGGLRPLFFNFLACFSTFSTV